MVYSPLYTSATNVYNKTGLSQTEVNLTTNDTIIEDAEKELEMLTGRKWTNSISYTEYLDGPKQDVLGISGQKAKTITLSQYPILTITGFTTLNIDGTTNTTFANLLAGYETSDYWMDTNEDPLTGSLIMTGGIMLKNTEFPVGIKNIKVVYTYGYSAVPTTIRDIATCLSGIRMWVNFLGGGYNRLNSYSIPQQSVSKGDFYTRGMQSIQNLTDEASRLLDRAGRKPRVLFYASGRDR